MLSRKVTTSTSARTKIKRQLQRVVVLCRNLDFAKREHRLEFDKNTEAAARALVAEGGTELVVGITEDILRNTRQHTTRRGKKGLFKIAKVIVICSGALWVSAYGTDTCPEHRARRVIEKLALTANGTVVGLLNVEDNDGMHPSNHPTFGAYCRVGTSDEFFREAASARLFALSNGGQHRGGGTRGGPRRRR